ncbi:MAG TPA: amidohydrolase family protein [Chthoniobacteraceae bacterium]|nr:amidohydrolase family protein [Chthoniobacteraceae bacterium]
MKLLRARLVVTMEEGSPPIEDGGVLVAGGKVVAAGPFHEIAARAGRTPERLDLGETVLLPGLINAHCHLDYTAMRGKLPPQASFSRWIGEINALKASWSDDDYLASITEGFAELRRYGTSTVVNLAAFPHLLARLPQPFPVRTWWVPELIDLRDPAHAGQLLDAALATFAGRPPFGGYGVSPHALYTASPGLYRLCAQAATRDPALRLTTHLAESCDEEAMFREGTGPLATFLAGLGRPMDDCGRRSPFAQALATGLISPEWLLAHVNTFDKEDARLMAATGAPWFVAHCPKSHAYFRHPAFPWQRLEAAGAIISIGTDSLASNTNLNLFEELRAAQKTVPGLTSETLLRTVTVNPARALGQQGRLGVIAPGAFADLLALPYTGSSSDVYNAIVAHQPDHPWMMHHATIAP